MYVSGIENLLTNISISYSLFSYSINIIPGLLISIGLVFNTFTFFIFETLSNNPLKNHYYYL